MFSLCPKISNNREAIEEMQSYIVDSVEIAMVDDDINTSMINELDIKNIIIHAGGEYCNISYSNEYRKQLVRDLLKNITRNVTLLFHCGWFENELIDSEQTINYIEGLLAVTDCNILLENTIDVSPIYAYDRAISIVNEMNNDRVALCLDTSHIRAMLNRGIDVQEYYKGISRCKHIHFNYSSNGDGFKNMSTHGVNHSKVTAVEDLKLLKTLGITSPMNITLCPEVMEKDNDYSVRTNQIKEIELLRELELVR